MTIRESVDTLEQKRVEFGQQAITLFRDRIAQEFRAEELAELDTRIAWVDGTAEAVFRLDDVDIRVQPTKWSLEAQGPSGIKGWRCMYTARPSSGSHPVEESLQLHELRSRIITIFAVERGRKRNKEIVPQG